MNPASDLPSFPVELIDNPPRAGGGVRARLFRVSRQLHAHMTQTEMFNLLRAALKDCGRYVPDREISDAIKNSAPIAWRATHGDDSGFVAQPAWSARDRNKIDALVRQGCGLYDLRELSPVRFDGPAPGPFTEEIVDVLFPGNPLLCVGESQYNFATRRRAIWRGRLSAFPFIVPSAMTKVKGKTAEGKDSEHCLENTAPRRFLVVEFDFGLKARDGVTDSEWAALVRSWASAGISVADACAALLVHLGRQAPLALAVHSGGKSVHGWFYCLGQNEILLRAFMDHAHTLGADHATWCRSQFVRMPDGTRENGNRQSVHYFNPRVVL